MKENADEAKVKAQALLTKLRGQIVMTDPFLASVIMALDLKAIRDSRIDTACTDGLNIFFDVDFMSKLSDEEIKFVLAHEIWHNVMHHTGPKGRLHTNPDDWLAAKMANIATDIEVNEILADMARQDSSYKVPDSACLADKYGYPRGKSAEEYYKLLYGGSNHSQPPQMSGSGSNGKPGKKGGGGQQQQQNQQNGNGNAGQQSKPDVNGKDRTGHARRDANINSGTFDKHNITSASPDIRTEDKFGKVGHDPDFNPESNPEEIEKAVERIKSAAIAGIHEVMRKRGKCPGALETLLGELTEPTVSWEHLITEFVTKGFGMSERTYNPPNKRYASRDIYLPSHRGKKINIALGIDTSGSTIVDLNRFMSELKGLLDTFSNYELTVIHCDTKVQWVGHYDGTCPFDFEDEENTSLRGGGGTTLHPIFKEIEENWPDTDMAVVFTDGCCEEFNEDNLDYSKPLLWVVSSEGTTQYLKVGNVVQLSKEDPA